MSPRIKRPHSPSLSESASVQDSEGSLLSPLSESPTAPPDSPHKNKKLKLLAAFTVDSPFPHFAHPTPAEALEVHNLLSKQHRTHDPTRKAPSTSSNSSKSCGNVPNVIEALIGTILSQNTSAANSSGAKTNLDAVFGRNNFAAIADSPRADVVEAIRHGGLANKKAATIQNLLKSIKAKHGDYSLQHLAETKEGGNRMSNDEVMNELVSYDGVGPKTASCVLLFCLGRDSFAVDTHVFRLSKVLGWVPEKADRVLAQAHLDLRIPSELKYGLHVLMIQHGRTCKGCKNKGTGVCVLKAYLKENKLRLVEGAGQADDSD